MFFRAEKWACRRPRSCRPHGPPSVGRAGRRARRCSCRPRAIPSTMRAHEAGRSSTRERAAQEAWKPPAAALLRPSEGAFGGGAPPAVALSGRERLRRGAGTRFAPCGARWAVDPLWRRDRHLAHPTHNLGLGGRFRLLGRERRAFGFHYLALREIEWLYLSKWTHACCQPARCALGQSDAVLRPSVRWSSSLEGKTE